MVCQLQTTARAIEYHRLHDATCYLMNELPIELESAYRAAEYWVGNTRLRIGDRSDGIVAFHDEYGVVESAYVTAHNPASQAIDAASNAVRQASLEHDIATAGFRYRQGIARDPNGVWPDEDGCLIFGIDVERAHEFARRYGQLAFLHIGRGGVPRLIVVGGCKRFSIQSA